MNQRAIHLFHSGIRYHYTHLHTYTLTHLHTLVIDSFHSRPYNIKIHYLIDIYWFTCGSDAAAFHHLNCRLNYVIRRRVCRFLKLSKSIGWHFQQLTYSNLHNRDENHMKLKLRPFSTKFFFQNIEFLKKLTRKLTKDGAVANVNCQNDFDLTLTSQFN